MAKEKEVKEEEEKEARKAIAPIVADYGREDLNALGAKVNEIVEALNK